MKHIFKKCTAWLMALVMVASVLFNASLTVYAVEPELTYSLSVDSRSSASGTIALSVGGSNVTQAKENDVVTITTTPNEGKSCSGVVVTKSSKTTSIGMTALSAYPGSDSKGNLFDGSSTTSWQSSVPTGDTDEIYIIFKVSSGSTKYVVTGYSLDGLGSVTNSNDSKWKSFSLYGGNFANDSNIEASSTDWKAIQSFAVEKYDSDKVLTSTISSGAIDNYIGYKYYMIKVGASKNADTVKMNGITFSGYEVDNTSVGEGNTFTMPAYPVMVMANFVSKPKLSYDLNEGKGTAPATVYCNPGDKVKVADASGISNPGYEFKGWTMYESDGNNGFKLYKKDDEITVIDDVILYAYWEEKPSPFTGITVAGYNGEYDGAEHSISVSGGNGVTIKYSETGAENTYTLTEAPKKKNAGQYVTYYQLSKDGEVQTGSATINISKKPITVFVSNMTKKYGDPDPVIGQSNCELIGTLATGDTIDTISLTRQEGEKVGVYAYSSENSNGTNKANIVIKNGSTNVTDNYDIISYADCSLSINKKGVTVSGITAKEKLYDGTTTATLDFSGATGWKVGTDKVNVTAIGEFDNKNVGTGKTVTISGITLTGEDADNYELASAGQQESCTANIGKKPVIVNGIKAKNKVFDGTDSATLIYDDVTFTDQDNNNAVVGGDVLSVEAVGKFAESSLGKDKIVNLSNITLTGAASGNYILSDSGQQTTCKASIVSSTIKVSGIKAKNKVYDGTNDVELDCTDMMVEGVKAGEDVTVTATGKFVDKSVGTKKQVAISYTLSGADSGNYAIASSASEAQRSTTADITKKEVTVSGITVAQKVYDGTTDATIDYSKATYEKIDGDDLEIATAVGKFNDKNVGDDKVVTVSGITFTGEDASNYSLKSKVVDGKTVEEETVISNCSIKPCPVTVNGITVKSKVYDGTTDAQLDLTAATIDGKLEDETLSFTASGTFADKNAGNDKDVTLSGLTLSGKDSANYTISASQSYTLKGEISAKEVVVSGIAAKSKNYDGNVEATLICDGAKIAGSDGKIAAIGEDQIGVEATGEFEDKDNGKEKTVYIKNITLTGNDSINYVLAASGQQETCTADISGIPVSVSGITAKSKIYDGKTNAELDLSKAVLQGVDEGDKVYVSAIGEFEDSKVGDGKTVKLRSVQLTGKDAANYALVDTTQTECKADIKPVAVKVSGINAENKEYDDKETATLSFDNVKIEGVIKSDKVTVLATGTFADKYPGEGKEVIITDLTLTGKDADNYVFSEDGKQDKTIANITLVSGSVTDRIDNGDGSTTIRETEYKDGQPTNKVTNVTYDENGVSLIEKNTYDDSGELEKSVAFSVNSEREIYQMVVKSAEGEELVCTDETEVTFGSENETVEQIKANLKNAEIDDYQKGSVLDCHDISPEEMAFLLKDEDSTMELLAEAINAGETEDAIGGASVTVDGFDGTFDSAKEDVLKLALTPTEIVEMLASDKTTDVVIKFSEEVQEDNDEAKEKIAELVTEDEDVFIFSCDMYKGISGSDEYVKVTEFENAIGTSFVIPVKLRKDNRTYRLIGSHKDVARGEVTAAEIALTVDEDYNASFASDKLCLMALAYTDDDIKAEKKAEKEAAEKAVKDKEAAEKAAIEKAEAERKTAEKEAAEKEAAKKAEAKAAEEAKEAAKKETEAKATALKTASEKETARLAEKKAAEEAAAQELKEITVTPEEMEKNSVQINTKLKVDQKGSNINATWGKVDGCENYEVFVQYCGKAFSEVPDATLDSATTNVVINKVNGKKLNLKKNYKIYVIGYKTVKDKKVVLAKSLTAHVVGRKNAKYTNGKSIKILSSSNIEMNVKDVSIIKAKTNRVAKKKKLLTDSHAKEFRYASSDTKVATVTKTGVIKAVGSGTCKVYVYSRNGYAKKITVTVK